MIKNIKNKIINNTKKTFKDIVMKKSFLVYGLLSFALLYLLCPGASIGSLLFSTFMGLFVCFVINFLTMAIFTKNNNKTKYEKDNDSYSATKKIYFQFNKDKIKQYKNSKEKEIFNNLK